MVGNTSSREFDSKVSEICDKQFHCYFFFSLLFLSKGEVQKIAKEINRICG